MTKPLITTAALLAFAAVAVLGWRGWRSYQGYQQTQALLNDRLTETAGVIAREIGAELNRWDALAEAEENVIGLPAAGTLVVFRPEGVTAVKGDPLAYYPSVAIAQIPPDPRLIQAQEAEFRTRDLDAAIAGYRDAATSTARTARAMATAGLARMLRAKGNTGEALTAYAELAQMDEARVDGQPAPLVAYRERQAIFQALGDSASAGRERVLIAVDLLARKYIIDRKTFDAFAPALDRGQYPKTALARAAALTDLWARRQTAPSGRSVTGSPEHSVATVWRSMRGGSVAIVAPTDALMEQALRAASRLSTAIALEDADGRQVWGEIAPNTGSATLPLADIRLSARLRVWLKGPG